jgi:hypothetical protein
VRPPCTKRWRSEGARRSAIAAQRSLCSRESECRLLLGWWLCPCYQRLMLLYLVLQDVSITAEWRADPEPGENRNWGA